VAASLRKQGVKTETEGGRCRQHATKALWRLCRGKTVMGLKPWIVAMTSAIAIFAAKPSQADVIYDVGPLQLRPSLNHPSGLILASGGLLVLARRRRQRTA
jgi:hypothetical protein